MQQFFSGFIGGPAFLQCNGRFSCGCCGVVLSQRHKITSCIRLSVCWPDANAESVGFAHSAHERWYWPFSYFCFDQPAHCIGCALFSVISPQTPQLALAPQQPDGVELYRAGVGFCG